jgi:hypothetical protein
MASGGGRQARQKSFGPRRALPPLHSVPLHDGRGVGPDWRHDGSSTANPPSSAGRARPSRTGRLPFRAAGAATLPFSGRSPHWHQPDAAESSGRSARFRRSAPFNSQAGGAWAWSRDQSERGRPPPARPPCRRARSSQGPHDLPISGGGRGSPGGPSVPEVPESPEDPIRPGEGDTGPHPGAGLLALAVVAAAVLIAGRWCATTRRHGRRSKPTGGGLGARHCPRRVGFA